MHSSTTCPVLLLYVWLLHEPSSSPKKTLNSPSLRLPPTSHHHHITIISSTKKLFVPLTLLTASHSSSSSSSYSSSPSLHPLHFYYNNHVLCVHPWSTKAHQPLSSSSPSPSMCTSSSVHCAHHSFFQSSPS